MKGGKIQISPVQARKRVIIVMMPSNFVMHVAGPYDVFNLADRILMGAGSSHGYDVSIVSPTRKTRGISSSGMEINCRHSFFDIKGPVDTVLVAGNDFQNMDSAEYAEFYRWLAKLEKQHTRRIGSICGGAFSLAKAGLLNGRRATTHWEMCQRLESSYPLVKVDSDAFHIQDGPIYTSGGASAGIDLALALVEQDHGKEVALAVARRLVVFLTRPGGQLQFGNLLPVFESSALAQKLRPWLNEHLHEPLDVVRLANYLSMSPRNFTRVFHKQTGLPPAKYIEKFRVESARKYLEDTDLGLEHIAEKCGLGGLVSMRRTFLRHLMTTPSNYRRTFRTSSS
ncbi:helix-turn-helix domain-containing protein [Chitinophaga agrisoli]|uniref:Helix-turn-helix domain-containing protein n=1 Tax=Chitinophaga agrisoli TaxID=2607653 RepID=A0A5B2VL04_9BACT|nr:helix-turn-helix domain-containing protein [Chitinophaga agrisoli]KAA2239388.1 helix-turn-helix domain-containing protein [Chitinophaga agrisoli]